MRVRITHPVFDGSRVLPEGEVVELPPDAAEDLVGIGAAERDAPESPRSESAQVGPGGGAISPGDSPARVDGVGPKTAAALVAAGVSTLADLAGLADDRIPSVAEAASLSPDRLSGWRGKARAMIDPGGDA